MSDIISYVRTRLFEMQDEQYGDFNSKLIPNIKRESIIGVRSPDLRRIGREVCKTADADEYIKVLPHKYFEEYNLHGFIIERIKDYDRVVLELDRFLPYVDNWATCDSVSPKVFEKHLDRLDKQCVYWIASGHTYTVRFGIGMLMRHYLDEYFDEKYLLIVAGVNSDEYYIMMMKAWYFATALAKQYEKTLPVFERRLLDKQTHNKAIQKARESYRISPEQKQYLKSLRMR